MFVQLGPIGVNRFGNRPTDPVGTVMPRNSAKGMLRNDKDLRDNVEG